MPTPAIASDPKEMKKHAQSIIDAHKRGEPLNMLLRRAHAVTRTRLDLQKLADAIRDIEFK